MIPVITFAVGSIVAMSVSVALVASLHRLEPEFDPSWRMLSEYSLGRFGVLMRLAFITGAIGVIASACLLFQATPWGTVALVLTSAGPLGAAFVDTDPITTARSKISARSKVHSALGSLYILGFPIAATFAGVTSGDPILGWSSVLPWVGLIWFMTATITGASPDGVGNPEHKIGWPNRFSMLTYFGWLLIVCVSALAN